MDDSLYSSVVVADAGKHQCITHISYPHILFRTFETSFIYEKKGVNECVLSCIVAFYVQYDRPTFVL